jgi:multidrug efflux system membrane fusion protein
MKRLVGIGVVVAAATGAACARHEAAEKPSRPVRVERVRSELAEGGLRYSAVVQPYEQVQLAFKVSGYVRELRQLAGADGVLRSLQQGDFVAKGSVLARINPADYAEKVNQARAQLAEADASLAKAGQDFARADALYRGKALTRPDYDAAQAALAGAQARVLAGRAVLEAAELALRDAAIVAPADGVILSRSIEVGTLANPGTAAFVLADLSRVKAVFGVPDGTVQRVKLGAPFAITSDAYAGAEFAGRVTAVSPSADAQSRVFNVEVTIPNPDRRLKAGMIASVEVGAAGAAEIPEGSPTVSVSAVVKSGKPGAFAVFVADGPDAGATARSRDVTLGRISGNRVAVSSGLQLGERVIVSGASLLTSGDRVRVIPGSEGE